MSLIRGDCRDFVGSEGVGGPRLRQACAMRLWVKRAGLKSASSRETWAGAQRSRPAGVRTPRASNSLVRWPPARARLEMADLELLKAKERGISGISSKAPGTCKGNRPCAGRWPLGRTPSLIVPFLSSHRRLMHLSNRRPAECGGRVFRYAFDERGARIPREEAQAQSRIPRTRQTTRRNRVRSCTNCPMGL